MVRCPLHLQKEGSSNKIYHAGSLDVITIVAMFKIVAINHNCRNTNHNCRKKPQLSQSDQPQMSQQQPQLSQLFLKDFWPSKCIYVIKGSLMLIFCFLPGSRRLTLLLWHLSSAHEPLE